MGGRPRLPSLKFLSRGERDKEIDDRDLPRDDALGT